MGEYPPGVGQAFESLLNNPPTCTNRSVNHDTKHTKWHEETLRASALPTRNRTNKEHEGRKEREPPEVSYKLGNLIEVE